MIRRLVVSLLAIMPGWMRLAAEARHYTRFLKRFQIEKEPDLRLALQMVNSGDTVVDIGANVGLWTVHLAKRVEFSGQIIAIEPVPTTFAILEKIVDRLIPDQSSVQLFNCAVSNKTGTIGMEVPKDSRNIRNHYLAKVVSGKGEIEVEKKPLDEILSDVKGNIRFIKIDTEGHELSVIQGGLKTLRHHLPILCIEISSDLDDPSSKGGRLVHILNKIGYSCHTCHHNRLQPRKMGEAVVNYFFLPPSELATQ